MEEPIEQRVEQRIEHHETKMDYNHHTLWLRSYALGAPAMTNPRGTNDTNRGGNRNGRSGTGD